MPTKHLSKKTNVKLLYKLSFIGFFACQEHKETQ